MYWSQEKGCVDLLAKESEEVVGTSVENVESLKQHASEGLFSFHAEEKYITFPAHWG